MTERRPNVVQGNFRKPAGTRKAEELPLSLEQTDRVLIATATGLQSSLAQTLSNATMLLAALKLRADKVRAGERSDG